MNLKENFRTEHLDRAGLFYNLLTSAANILLWFQDTRQF